MLGQCSICQEHFEQTSSVSALHCGHTFHYHCVLQWLERAKTCPSCRKATSVSKLIPQLYFDVTDSFIESESSSTLRNKVSDLESQARVVENTLKETRAALEKAEQAAKQSVEYKATISRLESTVKSLQVQMRSNESELESKKTTERENERLKTKLLKYMTQEKLLHGSLEGARQDFVKLGPSDKESCLTILKNQYDKVLKEKSAAAKENVDLKQRNRKLLEEVNRLKRSQDMFSNNRRQSLIAPSKRSASRSPELVEAEDDEEDLWSTTVVGAFNQKLLGKEKAKKNVGEQETEEPNVKLPGGVAVGAKLAQNVVDGRKRRSTGLHRPCDGMGGRRTRIPTTRSSLAPRQPNTIQKDLRSFMPSSTQNFKVTIRRGADQSTDSDICILE